MSDLPLDMKPEGWGQVSTAYAHAVAPLTRPYADRAVGLLGVNEGDRVLDVAAGTGSTTLALIDAGAEVVSTDFSPQMIDRLRETLSATGAADVEVLVMDGQDLKFADRTFDAVISVFGVMFFPDRDRGFREMHRVLVDSGRAAVATWADPSKTFPISVFGAALRQLLPDWEPAAPPAIYSLSDPDAFAKEMAAAGFNDVTVTPSVGTFDADSPESYFKSVVEASPVFTVTKALIGDREAEYRDIVTSMIRERFGDGPLRMESESLIAIGTK